MEILPLTEKEKNEMIHGYFNGIEWHPLSPTILNAMGTTILQHSVHVVTNRPGVMERIEKDEIILWASGRIGYDGGVPIMTKVRPILMSDHEELKKKVVEMQKAGWRPK